MYKINDKGPSTEPCGTPLKGVDGVPWGQIMEK